MSEPNLTAIDREGSGQRITSASPASPPSSELLPRVIGLSRWANTARRAVLAHAAHDRPLLIQGEAGTGKRFLAELIHNSSQRSDRPFGAISLALLSEDAAINALFGRVGAARSGRHYASRGLIHNVGGGTLYLDGALGFSPPFEGRLLRLIEYGEFSRAGNGIIEQSEARIIIGSTRTLERRLCQCNSVADELMVPPLRERKADIEPLSKHFLRTFCANTKREIRHFTRDALEALRRYDWPGNVSELRRVIEYAVRESEPPPITASLLPAHLLQSAKALRAPVIDSTLDLTLELKRLEREFLLAALKRTHGVQAKAASLLGLKTSTLNRKIKQYRIDLELARSSVGD